MIAYRRLEGSQLAEGADSFIESCQAWDASTTVKGITIQNADPRVEPAWGLLNSTENSGGSIHIWVYPDLIYSFQSLPGIKSLLPSDETDYAAISKSVIYKQNLVAALDSMQICAFSNMAFGIRDYVNVINAVTGWNWSEDNLLEAGQRIFNMERSFDNYVGVHDDALPEKFLNSPISEGKNAGKVCHLEPMLKEYYAARGWNGGMAGS
jgi:aldehyde:ferredoxin oxidoreductase